MARYTVVFDRQAKADLSEIRKYIAEARGLEFADAFVERIIRHCESFATIPYRGSRRDSSGVTNDQLAANHHDRIRGA